MHWQNELNLSELTVGQYAQPQISATRKSVSGDFWFASFLAVLILGIDRKSVPAVGVNYYELNYYKCIPFLLILPESLENK